MTWHYEIKEYYDSTDDIEGVNIHYLWTPLGGVPDWDNQRVTRFMPRVQPSVPPDASMQEERTSEAHSVLSRLRRKILKLPQTIRDPQSDRLTNRYLLHHYFEIFQDGHRHYSPLYTEELDTGVNAQPARAETATEAETPAASSFTSVLVKESK